MTTAEKPAAPLILRICHSFVCEGKLQEHRKLIEGIDGCNTQGLVRCTECSNVRKLRPLWEQ